jgi:hypothetical protein
MDNFAREAIVKTYPSGERRLAKDPPRDLVIKAFDELGTHKAVAAAFGVTRHVVTRWISLYSLDVISRPDIRHSNFVRKCLANPSDRIRVAQWITDECSVGVTYSNQADYTTLLVGGSMNDPDALSVISSILEAKCSCSKSAQMTTLPLLGLRMVSAKACALLELLLPEMQGLKAMEARAALSYFPRTGTLPGRHTSDEFMIPVWKEFAMNSLRSWNARRRQKLSEDQMKEMARAWVERRIRRARRFIETSATS